MSINSQKEWVTPKRVAGALGIHVDTVYRRLSTGDIPSTRVGKQWRIPAWVIDPDDSRSLLQREKTEKLDPPKADPHIRGPNGPLLGWFPNGSRHLRAYLRTSPHTSRSQDYPGLYLLAAYSEAVQGVIAQVEVAEENNEITALKLLKEIPLEGALLTGDAIFAQKEICQEVMASNGDYFFLVKVNQQGLQDDIATAFAPPVSPLARTGGRQRSRSPTVWRRATGAWRSAGWKPVSD